MDLVWGELGESSGRRNKWVGGGDLVLQQHRQAYSQEALFFSICTWRYESLRPCTQGQLQGGAGERWRVTGHPHDQDRKSSPEH